MRNVIQKEKPGGDSEQETEPKIAVARGNLGLH